MTNTQSQSWRIGAAGAVVHQGRVLLVRHTYGEKQGRWALPGGLARPQERVDQTVIRELREETGLEVEIVDLIGLRTRSSDEEGALFLLFRVRPLSGEAAVRSQELDRIGWFSLPEIEAMDDQALLLVARNAARAALQGRAGLGEDLAFPERGPHYRGFLVKWGARSDLATDAQAGC